MTIYLATDHAGFELKEKIKTFLKEQGCQVEDLGNFKYDENDDYPDWIKPAAEKISKSPSDRAIVLGGSGQGEAMVANRYKNVRAAVLYKFDKDIVKLSREHNDANILSLGARFLKEKDALKAIKLWLETSFLGEERHKRRIAKI
jgi:ribose 5-phosphate isomerase B